MYLYSTFSVQSSSHVILLSYNKPARLSSAIWRGWGWVSDLLKGTLCKRCTLGTSWFVAQILGHYATPARGGTKLTFPQSSCLKGPWGGSVLPPTSRFLASSLSFCYRTIVSAKLPIAFNAIAERKAIGVESWSLGPCCSRILCCQVFLSPPSCRRWEIRKQAPIPLFLPCFRFCQNV